MLPLWGVLVSRVEAQVPAVTKVAFLVGVEKYQKDGLTDLNYPDDDVEALSQMLGGLGVEVDVLLRRPVAALL